jgi:hypothetical protein
MVNGSPGTGSPPSPSAAELAEIRRRAGSIPVSGSLRQQRKYFCSGRIWDDSGKMLWRGTVGASPRRTPARPVRRDRGRWNARPGGRRGRRRRRKAHGAEISCPISTSIFARIAAEAALEQSEAGASLSEVTPFRRVIDEASPIAKKLSCGVDLIRAQRTKEAVA